ncbi:nitrite reductase, copper-containing [Natronomonas pharaonis DSM 2160]|uniref:Copper-containing nitrite reductase n=1 Tax=Natronomonas pharaonis (strain ATCC 35678 / DSM 2160 / CIP 103997 / JCM 8858 / NBRC 14720 / NCIMB 2260 / Gabara) TaxID=348780 RepID=A0A1U7EV61_NATPD|nr:copper-containing nitrite reductase [Natronomonas pharaonis]CAI48890.1 nitrite reductase, copper-containing [Natronomonas pharaonis DSM 2160]
MTQNTNPNRRTFLKAAGAGGAFLLAGCVGNEGEPTDESTPEPAPQQAGLDPAQSVDTDRIAADPRDIPDPVDWDEPRHHEIEIATTEEIAEVEPGVTFQYMTFGGQVPGPMVRVREGDTINLTLTNESESAMPHNIDFHATYGPGGGADDTTIGPGESATIEFQAMYPGIHVYHCAVPNMDHHISAGMFGAILVEPEDGLPEVDHEFYFGQHELYTEGQAGEEGHHGFDFDSMRAEDPTYVCLNGEAYAFTGNGYGPMTVDKGDTVRVFFASGGPNLTSSVHPIGNVMSRYYRDGDLLSEPDRNIETAPVAPGTVAAWEMETPVPGPIKIVDHALSRVVRKGMMGVIEVEGELEPDIYNPDP